ncbi:MAG: FadR/GntR family transcriptional regulator [Planctomycetota bacterium]
MNTSDRLIAKDIPSSLIAELKKHFLKQEYKPGDRIETEFELAGKFKVSRAKVREAMTAMYYQGLLNRKPRAGTSIRRLNPVSIGKDLAFRFRMAGFEGADAKEARHIIELAILPLVIRRITPSQFQRLEDIITHMESVIDDPKEADAADCNFHIELLRACGNITLQAFAGVIEGLFRDTIRKKYWTKELLHGALHDHQSLLKAIRQDDTEKAMDILRHHWKDNKLP